MAAKERSGDGSAGGGSAGGGGGGGGDAPSSSPDAKPPPNKKQKRQLAKAAKERQKQLLQTMEPSLAYGMLHLCLGARTLHGFREHSGGCAAESNVVLDPSSGCSGGSVVRAVAGLADCSTAAAGGGEVSVEGSQLLCVRGYCAAPEQRTALLASLPPDSRHVSVSCPAAGEAHSASGWVQQEQTATAVSSSGRSNCGRRKRIL